MILSEDIVIRIGEAKDASALSKIGAKLFNQTYAGKMPSKDLASYIAEEFGYDQQIAVLKNFEVTTLLAEHAGKLVGYAQVRRKPIPVESVSNVVIELWRIYLDKSSHGRGVGKLLLLEVNKTARAMSSDQIWLGVWEENIQAISFYEKHGFKTVGSQEFYVGAEKQNDIVMLGSINTF
jgi:ribosomal protein S18 acetylase RimI-like enzyme